MLCSICGGFARRLPDHGAHNLCAARVERGLPTPSLGNCCPDCDGQGSTGQGGVPLFLDHLSPGEIARSIAAQFPACVTCAGSGIIA